MYSRKVKHSWLTIPGQIFFLSIVLTIIIISCISECKVIRECRDMGGHWEKYNCRTTYEMKCSYEGIKMSECHMEGYEQCNERCAFPAEKK